MDGQPRPELKTIRERMDYIAKLEDRLKQAESERNHLQAEINRIKQEGELLIRHAPTGIFEIDFQSPSVKSANDAMCEILGYSREEFLAMNPFDILDETSQKIFQDRIHQNLAGQPIDPSVEYRIYKKNGEVMHTVLHTSVQFQAGKPHSAFVIAHDITERKKAEEALLEATRKAEHNQLILDSIIQQMPAGIIITDATGLQAKNNQEMDRIWRRSMLPEENIDEHAYRAFHPDGREYLLEEWPLTRALKNGEVILGEEMTCLRGDGTKAVLHVSSAPIHGKDGEIIAGVVIDVDITDRKRVEEALQTSEERLTDFLESTHDSFFALDHDWRFLYANHQFCTIMQRNPEDLVGKNFWEEFPDYRYTVIEQNYHRVMDHRIPVHFELGGIYTQNWFEISVYPTHDGISVFSADQTNKHQAKKELEEANAYLEQRVQMRTAELERSAKELKNAMEQLESALTTEKLMRKQLIQTEKFTALARLVASVAHEINNPLQTIQNCLYLLQEAHPSGETDEMLEMAINESSRISSLVRQLRETYRPAKDLQVVDIDLVDLLENVKAILQPQLRLSNVTWQFPYYGFGWFVCGIPDQIKQVFLNICLNAIDAIGETGGTLGVKMVRAKRDKKIGVLFSDSGPGIPPEDMDKIFEPFFTTKKKGTGLGLAISYEIIKDHGGEITVESQPGKGATFQVWLPVKESNH